MVTGQKADNRMAKKNPPVGKGMDAKMSDVKTSDIKVSDAKATASETKGNGRQTGPKAKEAVPSVLEQNATLKTTLQQIERQFGEGAIMPLGTDKQGVIAGISTGSLSLDLALGGQGIPRGRIIEIFGPESSGKTTLALHVVAQAQQQGGIAAFIDAEHALDPSWAKKLGVRAGNAAGQPAHQRRRGDAHHRDADQVQRRRRDRRSIRWRP